MRPAPEGPALIFGGYSQRHWGAPPWTVDHARIDRERDEELERRRSLSFDEEMPEIGAINRVTHHPMERQESWPDEVRSAAEEISRITALEVPDERSRPDALMKRLMMLGTLVANHLEPRLDALFWQSAMDERAEEDHPPATRHRDPDMTVVETFRALNAARSRRGPRIGPAALWPLHAAYVAAGELVDAADDYDDHGDVAATHVLAAAQRFVAAWRDAPSLWSA